MKEKQTEILISPEEFPAYLKGRLDNTTVVALAAELGVTTNLVYMLLSGKRTPSASIIKKLGLRPAYVFRGNQDVLSKKK
jgi:hypothetical protein